MKNSLQEATVALVYVSMALATACGQWMGARSACDGLVYKEYGLDREEYVPCVGEMVATMDRMRPLLEAALAGDQAARGEAQGLLRELSGLMEKAGGATCSSDGKIRPSTT